MQKKKIIGIIIGLAIIIIGGISFYYYKRESKFNSYINNVHNLMEQGDYKEAATVLNEAKNIKDSDIIKQTEETIKLDEEQSKVYDKGLSLAKDKKYKEAIDILEQVDSRATQIKDKANKEIEKLKNTLIEQAVKNANEYLNKNDFENVNKEIDKITAINVKDPNIQQLKDKETSKKKKLIAEYTSKANLYIDKNSYTSAKSYIAKLKSFGADDSTVKDLESKLNKKIKSEKYYNTKYLGISDTQKEGTQYFAAVPSKPLITRYYNPDLLTEKTFIKFYRDNIENKLYQGYCYVLRSTKDNNYGILFVDEPNENDEFNMGKLSPDGLLDIYSDSAAYCGIHGDKVVYYSLKTQQQISPLIRRD